MQKRNQDVQPNSLDLNYVSESNKGHECGYCKNPTGAYTSGFTCQKLSSGIYEQLINKGWRRCGTYYYKNTMDKCCCKSYTIRMNVEQFKIKKQQRKTVKNLLELVKQRKPKPKTKKIEEKREIPKPKEQKRVSVEKTIKMEVEIPKDVNISLLNILGVLTDKIIQEIKQLEQLVRLKQGCALNINIKDGIKLFLSKEGSRGNYYSNYVMLLYGKNKNSLDKTTLQDFCQQTSAFIVGLLRLVSADYDYNVQHSGYLIFTNRSHVLQEMKPIKEKKESTDEYIVIDSKDPGSEPRLKKKQNSEQFLPLVSPDKPSGQKKKTESLNVIEEEDSTWPDLIITDSKITFGRLEVTVVPVQQSSQSFALYSKYSKHIHEKAEKSMSSYTGFLCEDALIPEVVQKQTEKPIIYNSSWDEKGEHMKPIAVDKSVKLRLGCFHMKYELEGRLVGVGVIDIMPGGLSSVYFFYDHTFKEYRLGVFSSLLEIEYIKYLNKVFPQFKYYYMGFYIQNCQKMNYKADYEPCELLCPTAYVYVPVDKQLRQLIDNIINKKIQSSRLSEQKTPVDPDMIIEGDAGVYIDKNLKLYHRNKQLKLKDLDPRFFLPVLISLKNHVSVIGKSLFNQLRYHL